MLLNPERYPEFVSNGWLKANTLLVALLCGLAKVVGVLAAGRIVPFLVVGGTAFALPHFLLRLTDRRRLVVGSLFLGPMVHNWWTLMGMLNLAAGFVLALGLLILLARQREAPSDKRSLAIVALSALVWFAHGLVLLFVGLLALVDVIARPDPREHWLRGRLNAARAVLLPLGPMGATTLGTILAHRTSGHVDMVKYEPTITAVYHLWAHWTLGLSPLSAASLVNAVLLAYFAVRAARAPVPMFSIWAVVVLGAFYFLFPLTIPGIGYLCERALPFLWAWAIVRVPATLSRRTSRLLLASTAAWSIGLGADLFRGAADVDDFIAAAPEIPAGARLLVMTLEPGGSATNTWPLIHASGMYTVLRGAHPIDLWADSTSMPIIHRRAPAVFVEDPVRIRGVPGGGPRSTVVLREARTGRVLRREVRGAVEGGVGGVLGEGRRKVRLRDPVGGDGRAAGDGAGGVSRGDGSGAVAAVREDGAGERGLKLRPADRRGACGRRGSDAVRTSSPPIAPRRAACPRGTGAGRARARPRRPGLARAGDRPSS